MRNEMLINRVRVDQVDRRISVADQEIDYFLTTMEHQGQVGEEYRVGHILLAASGDTAAEASEARVEALLQQLRDGADFGQLARENSVAASAQDGGDLGWRKLPDLPALFSEKVRRLEVGEVNGPIRIDDDLHIIKLLEKRASQQIMVRQTHARHILLRVPEEAGDDGRAAEERVQEQLRQLRARILGGEDFAALAQEYSQDLATSLEGGDLGWVSKGRLPADFEEFIDRLAPNEISQPFRSLYGWHLVEVLERRDHNDTEQIMRTRAHEFLRQRKLKEAHQSWLNRLREEAYIEYRLLPDRQQAQG